MLGASADRGVIDEISYRANWPEEGGVRYSKEQH